MSQITVHFETTPNPQTLKFLVSQPIATDSAAFADAKSTTRSPLARKIFGFPWCDGVFIGKDFVTVTKQDWVDWDVLAEPLAGLIAEHIDRGDAVLQPQVDTPVDNDTSPVAMKIKQILNDEIRPAVALDGGDIVFHKYEDHILYVYMQGSCAGCPSSTFTLKEGIENRLRNEIPELREVVAV